MFTLSTTLKKLMANATLAAMLMGLFAPTHAVADGNTGTIMVRVNPEQGAYQVLDNVTGAVTISLRSGSSNFAGIPAGDYRIAYGDLDGFTKPADESFSLVAGGQVTLTGDYAPITHSANLSVVVSPDTGRFEIRDNALGAVVVTERSGSQNFTLPFGDYIVDFKDINGYSTPADQSLSLDASHLNVTVTGIYQTVSNSGTVSITVSPAIGKYEINDNVTGDLIVAEHTGSSNFTLPFGDYIVNFKDIVGYTTPASQAFSLNAASTSIAITGNYTSMGNTGTLTVTVSPAAGTYDVRDNVTGAVLVAQTSGTRSFTLAFGDYIVNFMDINGYVKPASQAFTLDLQHLSVSIAGNYTTQPGTGTVVVNVLNQANQAITDANWELLSCSAPATCVTVVANNTQSATLRSLVAGTYKINARLTPAYSGVVVLSTNPQALAATQTTYFNIQYTSAAVANTVAGIQVTTLPVAGGIRINGQPIGAPSAAGTFVPASAYQVNITEENVISFEAVAGYTTPSDIRIAAGTLVAGSINQYTGTYQLIGSNAATLALTTTPVAGAISVNGTVVGTPANAGAVIPFRVTNPGDYTVSFGAVANYTTPANQTITVTAAQIQANATIPVTGVYTPVGSVDNATLRITTNVVNAPVSVDGVLVGNASPATPVSTTVRIDQAHTISFGAVADYTAPANIVLAANTLQRNEVRDVMGTYTPSKLVTITKTAAESPVANNNKRVIYTLVVTNVGNSPLSVTVSDTITGTGKIVNNGGELVYVPGTFSCTGATCTVATPDGIANQPVTVALQNNGSAATLKYEMLSNNAGQTGPATFSNTATATYIDPANSQTVTSTVAQTTTVGNPTPVNPGNNGSTSGSSGGSGVGGGHSLIKGDMNLTIQKLVSTDGKTFRSALGNKQAMAIPENQTTKLYVKIVVTNPSDLSARNIRLAPFFDTGKSDMTADKIQDLDGATLDIFKQILIEKIKSKETVEFTYNVLVHENGQNSNPAIEGLEVTDIDSFLPDTQDGLVYKNKGQKIGTYLYAGHVPAEAVETPAIPNVSGNGSDVLRIKITSDKSQAAIGETVNFTLTLTNTSDMDLTNLFLNHNLPHELSVVNAGGARNDGRTLAWKSAMLRPGESMTKRFSAKVVAGAPGAQLKSLTTALVSELEGIEPVESILMVLGGAPAGYRLAQTGPASLAMLMVLAFLSALAFTAFDKRRTLKLKEAALKPL